MARRSHEPMLRCLNRNHWWEPTGRPSRPADASWDGFRVGYLCVTCGSECYDTVDIYFRRLGTRQYHYSPEYRQLLDTIEYNDEFSVSEQKRALYFKSMMSLPKERRAS